MSRPSPPVRVALTLLALLTFIGVSALTVLLAGQSEQAERAAQAELATAAATLSATLDAPAAASLLTRRLREAASETGFRLAVYDREGERIAASGPGPARLPETLSSEEGAPPQSALMAGEEYLLATATSPGGRYRVLALRRADEVGEAFGGGARRTVVVGLLAWLAAAAALGGLAWYAGRPTAARVEALAHRIAGLHTDEEARTDLGRAAQTLGPLATALSPLATALVEARAEAAESKSHVAALLQINPHYVLLCTLDGHIVDANPAFYAMSGLPFEAVRGNRIEVLEEVMPVEPLFELAERSLRENASIGGIEYAVINRDDTRRTVQVSLRSVQVGGKDAVLIQATDVANQRNLERQVSTFSDALDLMVDQRVAQLTAGNASMSRLLDEAGVPVASFDGGGSTRRWSRAAEAFTGRRHSQVPHFTAFMSVLGLSPEGRKAFDAWFWDAADGSIVLDTHGGDGPPRRMLWRKATTTEGSRAGGRLLVGVEMPQGEGGDGMDGLDLAAEGADLPPSFARA